MSGRKLPAGIDQRPSGLYRVRMSYRGRQYAVGNFYTLGDAKAGLAIARGEKARGTFVPPIIRQAKEKAELEAEKLQTERDTKTVQDLAEAWLSWLESMGRSVGTVYTYRRLLEANFLPTFGPCSVTSISAEDVTRWYDALVESHGVDVARKAYRSVSAMFRYAAGQTKGLPRTFKKWLDQSPADVPAASAVGKAPAKSDEPVATPAEIAAIAKNMPEREALGVMLAGWCALRIGEVLGLRRRDIAKDDHGVTWLRITEQVQARGSGVRLDPPKTAAGVRDVPVPASLVPQLQNHLKRHVSRSGDSFLLARKPGENQPHNPNTFRRHFNAARDVVNNASKQQPPRLEAMTFHGLRHSCLTRLGQAGATLADLMAYAGHSDVESVLVYQHSEKRRLAALSSAIDVTPAE